MFRVWLAIPCCYNYFAYQLGKTFCTLGILCPFTMLNICPLGMACHFDPNTVFSYPIRIPYQILVIFKTLAAHFLYNLFLWQNLGKNILHSRDQPLNCITKITVRCVQREISNEYSPQSIFHRCIIYPYTNLLYGAKIQTLYFLEQPPEN